MQVSSRPTPSANNWFTAPRIKNNTIYSSPAENVADAVALSANVVGVATGAAALAGAISPGILGGAALTVAGAVAGFCVGGIGSGLVKEGALQLFGSDRGDDGGAIAGGAVLGTVSGAAGALAGSLGASPGGVALTALGTSAVIVGALFIADRH